MIKFGLIIAITAIGFILSMILKCQPWGYIVQYLALVLAVIWMIDEYRKSKRINKQIKDFKWE